MKKHNILYFCLLILAMSMSSCSLYMDDEALRADQIGFGEHATMNTPYGDVEYQFKDSVYSITDNVLEYIARIENDSVIYYLESTPSYYIPKVDFCVSAPSSRKMPYGLNNHVLSVEHADGLIKVTTSKCDLNKIYEYLNMNLEIPVSFNSVQAEDSVAASKNEKAEQSIIDWNKFDEYEQESGAQSSSKETTRGNDDDSYGNWWTAFDGDVINQTQELILVNFDTKKSLDDESTDRNLTTQLIEKIIDALESADSEGFQKFRNAVSMNAKISLSMNGVMHLNMGLNPDFHVHTTLSLQPKFSSTIGLQVEGSTELSKSFRDWVKKVKNTKGNDMISLALPSIFVPVPVASPAVGFYLEPRLNFGLSLMGYGRWTYSYPMDKVSCDIDYEYGGIPKITTQRSNDDTPSNNFTGGICASASASGGIGFGVGIAAGAVKFGLTDDIIATLSAEISTSTPDVRLTKYGYNSAYDPESNKLGFKINMAIGYDIGIKKEKAQKWHLDDLSFSDTFLNFDLFGLSKYIRPNVSSATISNKKYETVAGHKDLSSFVYTLSFADAGLMYDLHKDDALGKWITNAEPLVLVKGKTDYNSHDGNYDMDAIYSPAHYRYFKAESNPNYVTTLKNYVFNCNIDEYLKDPQGYDIVPCYVTPDGDTVQINGFARELLSYNSPVFKNCGITQAYGTDMAVSSEVVKAWEGYGLNSNKSYSPTAHTGVYYYSWLSAFDIQHTDLIRKWGIKVSVFSNVTGANSVHYYTIEEQSLKALTDGRKYIKLWFASTDDPNDILNGAKGPFTITVDPWYITDEAPDDRQYTNAKQKTTFKANQMHDDSVFKGKTYTTINKTSYNPNAGAKRR